MVTTKRQSPLNYVFAIGKVRALERFLIRPEVFEEAIEANLSEALRLFAEADLYSEELLRVKDSSQLEALLAQESLKLKKLMQDLILDKELLGLLEDNTLQCASEIIKSYPSEFLHNYLLHVIDMHNIKTFMRLFVLQEPKEALERLIAYEGYIKKDTFVALYQKELAAFLHRLEYVHAHNRVIDYLSFLKEGIEKAVADKAFMALEKAMHDFLIHVLKPAKYMSFGPEPVLAYYFAKINEINLMRMIILSKFNNIAVDLVKERLNAVYA